jgi:hypothetical protein
MKYSLVLFETGVARVAGGSHAFPFFYACGEGKKPLPPSVTSFAFDHAHPPGLSSRTHQNPHTGIEQPPGRRVHL